MWRHIDVQANWRSLTYGRAPNAINISYGSLIAILMTILIDNCCEIGHYNVQIFKIEK